MPRRAREPPLLLLALILASLLPPRTRAHWQTASSRRERALEVCTGCCGSYLRNTLVVTAPAARATTHPRWCGRRDRVAVRERARHRGVHPQEPVRPARHAPHVGATAGAIWRSSAVPTKVKVAPSSCTLMSPSVLHCSALRLASSSAHEAWLAWYNSTPDTPCIAICSTSQGDETCKGCGRSFSEVQHWPQMTPGEKRHTWRRITLESSAWRFNKYAERAAEGPQVPR